MTRETGVVAGSDGVAAPSPGADSRPGPVVRFATETTSYGASNQQVVELMKPSAPVVCHGVVVLVHGGYWRAKSDRSLMSDLAADLLSRGWSVCNVEYRRTSNGGGWPQTGNDVRAGFETARIFAREQGDNFPLIAIGHSVGGQLALLGADLLDAVVALAPVTDVARTEREGLGEGAAVEFMGTLSSEDPAAYRQASPIRQLPANVPVLVVHGDNDSRVPLEHSQDYVRAARELGGDVELDVVRGLSHLEAIDPQSGHWQEVLRWIEGFAVSFPNAQICVNRGMDNDAKRADRWLRKEGS